VRVAPLTEKEVRAIRFAYEELKSYWELIGQETSLDDEELPTDLVPDALATLEAALVRLENARKR
jgi:hypothetical protein